MPDQDFYDVFLSHASEDMAWSARLAERLRNEGVRVWFDQWEIKSGHNLDVELNKGIETSRKMVAVWSAHYFRKTWTQVEVFSRPAHGSRCCRTGASMPAPKACTISAILSRARLIPTLLNH